jgi:hypothetical protein
MSWESKLHRRSPSPSPSTSRAASLSPAVRGPSLDGKSEADSEEAHSRATMLNVVPTESHSDGQNAVYFLRILRTVLLALGYSEPPLFIGVLRLPCENSYLWRVCAIIYNRPTTDHIRRIRHVVEATTPRWTFEGGMREAAREALALL